MRKRERKRLPGKGPPGAFAKKYAMHNPVRVIYVSNKKGEKDAVGKTRRRRRRARRRRVRRFRLGRPRDT